MGMMKERIVPQLPKPGEKFRLLIDTDIATEIDDVYAISLALVSQERFEIEGFIGSHFAATEGVGPETVQKSCDQTMELLEVVGLQNQYPVKRGSHPMQYYKHYSDSEGVDFIIERAHSGSVDNPLWVVCLGAATNLASAILKDPSITEKVRYVFHGRSEETWPERSQQYNVRGDILAARTLLASNVPLVWFDTGTYLFASMDYTEQRIAPLGKLGRFLHDFRYRVSYFSKPDKGFFDLGDIAWMIQPGLCKEEVIDAPTMDPYMFYDHAHTNGKMLRVYDIEPEGTWKLLEHKLKEAAER